MSAVRLVAIVFISAFISISCQSRKTEARIEALEKKWADFETERNKAFIPDPYWNYTWFNLGQEYHQKVSTYFYITKISTTYKENGFQVNGIIANLSSMPMAVVKIKAAIKISNSTDVTYGNSEIPILWSARRVPFSIFVPTKETKISEIGISIEDYRQ